MDLFNENLIKTSDSSELLRESIDISIKPKNLTQDKSVE